MIRCGDLPSDPSDPVNRGVDRDEQIGTATGGVMIRRVTCTAPDGGMNKTPGILSFCRAAFRTASDWPGA